MPYSVSFTDSTNPAKPSITVADGSLNSQTSMTFVGQGYAGYASVFAGDLLHLLENFAAASAPVNPVQGQLWTWLTNPKLSPTATTIGIPR